MMKAYAVIVVLAFVAACESVDPCAGLPPALKSLVPYPGDCSRFYQCFNDIAVEEVCPTGLYFSPSRQACIEPALSGCTNIGIVCPSGVVDYFPNPSNCNQFYECYMGILKIMDCPPGLWYNPATKQCVDPLLSNCGVYSSTVSPTWTTPSYAACHGVKPGYIILKPYPYDCTRYIRCEGAEGEVQYCPPYLYFDYAHQMCEPAGIADCDASTATPDPTPTSTPEPPTSISGIPDPRCTSSSTVTYWPEPVCSQFIACWGGLGYLQNCPPGLNFDPITNSCLDPSLSSCGKTSPTPTPSTTRPTGWTPDPGCPWPAPGVYLFPYPGDCTKFFECSDGIKEVEVCPPDLWFNPSLLVCDYPYESGCIYG